MVGGFPADPQGDANGNGERDLIDYVLGNDLGLPPIFPKLTLQPDPLGGPVTLRLSYPVSLSAQERGNRRLLFHGSDDLAGRRDAP